MANALTEAKIRLAKPAAKLRKIFDGRGMFLLITPGGGKWWRFKYRFGGKAKTLSLGVYPDVGLREARDRRDEARKLLASALLSFGSRPSASFKRPRASAGGFPWRMRAAAKLI